MEARRAFTTARGSTMSNEYFECSLWKETKTGKKFSVRLGSAKKRDDGGFWVDLDAMPAPVDGRFSFTIQPQKDRQATAPAPARDEFSDSIPF